MTEVLVAIVTTGGLVVTALLANRGRQHAKAIQVQNSHSTNLREDLDLMRGQLSRIEATTTAHEQRLARIEKHKRQGWFRR
jgi:hypothetical protein